MKPPTALQLRVLRRILRTAEVGAVTYLGNVTYASSIHESAQVISRAVNLCRASGWLRIARDQELRLTVAGRQAAEGGGL